MLLVTGGDSGIGLGIARKFVEAGYRVAIGGLDPRKGRRVVATLRALGGDAVYFLADVRSEYQIRALIRRTVQRFGRIDVLCNNAGIQKLAPIDKASAAQWDDVMAVNARAAFLSSKYGLPHLKWSKGTIINIASTAGLVGYAGGLAYCASKAALVMMSKTTALEFAAYGIRVNCICPGATRTPLIPAQRGSRTCPSRFPSAGSANRVTWRSWRCFLPRKKPGRSPAVSTSSTAVSPLAGHRLA